MADIVHQFGRREFKVIPLYYSDNWLACIHAEAAMIEAYDTINNGFNVAATAHGDIGPIGSAFSTRLKEAHARPEVKAARRLLMQRIHAQPSTIAKRRAIFTSEPYREGQRQNMLGRIWINDGEKEIRILASDPMPSGWSKGRSPLAIRSNQYLIGSR